jgi:type IV pilus assembly protein PilB
MQPSRPRLGQMLVEASLLTEEQLAHLLERQKVDGRRLGSLVVDAGLVDEATITQVLSRQLNAPWVSLYHVDFYRQLLNLVPHEVAEQHCLIPVYVREVRRQGATLYVAMEDPTSDDARRACEQAAGLPVRAMIAPPSDIRKAIRVYYGVREGGIPTRRITKPASLAAPPASARPADEPSAPPSGRPPPDEPSATPSSRPAPDESRPTPSERPLADEHPAPIGGRPVGRRPGATSPPHDAEPALGPSQLPPPATPPLGLPRMMRLTLLDGTEIAIPAPRSPSRSGSRREAGREGAWTRDTQLTARDLIAALRAVAQGAEASEVLDSSATWEALFAALLSVLLRKHLIADWEFVEELKKV